MDKIRLRIYRTHSVQLILEIPSLTTFAKLNNCEFLFSSCPVNKRDEVIEAQTRIQKFLDDTQDRALKLGFVT